MSIWLIINVALAYVVVLFLLASYGEKRARSGQNRGHALIYALSFAVYCTSWTFFGTVGHAATAGWEAMAIYLGPILALLCFAPVLKKLVRVSKQQNITSIADFIASRYGKSQWLAALVSLMAVVAIVPYIALQLKGVAIGIDTLTQTQSASRHSHQIFPLYDFSFYLAIAMAVFSILFGTRRVNANESHQGIIYAVAFESLVKLAAFVAVGLFVTYSMFNGFGDLLTRSQTQPDIGRLFSKLPLSASFFSTLMMAMIAIVCLPRQFHVTVVENTRQKEFQAARWLFPSYLAILAIFVVPVAVAGMLYFTPGTMGADRFVLALPLAAGANKLALFAFIGGFSASTSMVIVATVALSTMICNDLIVPLLIRWHSLGLAQQKDFSKSLLRIRRIVIVVLLAAAYGYYHYLGNLEMLASIGLLSFAGVLQFAPALLGGLYIRRISCVAATAGMTAGFFVWAYTLVLPGLTTIGLLPAELLHSGPFGLPWLMPNSLFGFSMGDELTHGVVWSLAVNVGVTLVVSWLSSRSLIERGQANAFVGQTHSGVAGHLLSATVNVTVGDLQVLLGRFLGFTDARQILAGYFEGRELQLYSAMEADAELVAFCERVLSGAVGGASARILLESTLRGKELAIDDVVEIIDQTAQAVQFSRSLLQASLDNLSQGVSVIDRDLRLVAWNQRYLELFAYPEGMIRIGRPVETLIRYNAERGICGPGSVEQHVQKRQEFLRAGSSYVFRRTWPNGKVIEMQGNPMPGGGFVTTYSDISEHIQSQLALKEANETLEKRVEQRTNALSDANQQLRYENHKRYRLEEEARLARDTAERANLSKTRFLAAAGHDLQQPLSAARLFASALCEQGEAAPAIAANIERSLEAADGLLAGLLDISKLDSGKWGVDATAFRIDHLLQSLAAEFGVLAAEKDLAFRMVDSRQVVHSDRLLLRRILQNFLTNAIRYTRSGRILLGCRRCGDQLRIEVWDTGAGIAAEELHNIFEEFHRLAPVVDSSSQGLGLGLSIAQRLAGLLDHQIEVRSWPQQGTVFSVTVNTSKLAAFSNTNVGSVGPTPGTLEGVHVLCVDDDDNIRQGLATLLGNWSCQVTLASGRADLPTQAPDLVLADYQLSHESDGIELIGELRRRWGGELPAILVTANRDDNLRSITRERHIGLLHKPVKPAALRAALTQALRPV